MMLSSHFLVLPVHKSWREGRGAPMIFQWHQWFEAMFEVMLYQHEEDVNVMLISAVYISKAFCDTCRPPLKERLMALERLCRLKAFTYYV